MKYGKVSGLDKPISRLVLGTDHFNDSDNERIEKLLDAFAAAGGNCFDTAYIYGGGAGHRQIGRWMKANGNREEMVLLDKGCHPWRGEKTLTPVGIETQLMTNLDRFGTEYVDLWVFHRDDPEQPVEMVVEEMNRHIDAGRIFAYGGSNWTIERIESLNDHAAAVGKQGMSLNNPNLSLATANEPMWSDCITLDDAGREWHTRTQFPLFSWSSQARGFFAGVESDDVKRVFHNEVNFGRRERALALAKNKDVHVVSIALAYVLHQPFPTWALIGPHHDHELAPSLEGLELELTPEEIRYLEVGEPAVISG